MKKKKLILAVLAIALTISAIAIPFTTAFALPGNGVISQDRYSGVPGASWQVVGNNFIKYNYYGSGALLSRYFMTSGASTYACYPISSPIAVFNGETWQQPATLQPNWTSVMGGSYTLNSPIGAYGTTIAFRNYPDGAVTSYGTITADYSTLFLAYATMFEYGYQGSKDQGSAFGLGTDGPGQAARYYATNMAFQRISGQAQSKSDGGYFSMSGVPSQNVGVIQFEWYLEQKARHILCTPTPFFSDLQGSFGTPTRVNSTTVNIPVSVKIPDPTQAAYYSYNTDFAWTDLSTLSRQNQAAVTSTMSSFANGNSTSVSANLLVDSASIKGGEHLSFVVTGKAKSIQTEAQIYLTNEGPGNSATFMLRDETTGNTSNTTYLNTISTDTTLPLFDVQTTGITANASYNAGDTGTISVTYKNSSSLPAVNVPVSLASSSSLGTPFTISNANQTIGELLPGASTTVTYNITANTLSGNTTATFTAKIGYNTDGSTRFNETNYTNNTLTKNITINSVPDFSCTYSVSDYIGGQDAVFAVTINNGGVIGNPNVPIRLTVGSTSYDTTIPMPIGQNLAVFRVTMPNVTGNVNVTAVVDPNNIIPELNETNNSTTHSVPVTQLHTPTQIDALNNGLEQTYLTKNKQLPTVPNNPDSTTHTWQEYRYEGGSYVLHTYTATLTIAFNVKPDSRITDGNVMQSGFGIEQTATATLTTDYDHPEKLVGVQDVWLTYPETYYGLDNSYYTGYYEPMTSSTMGALSNAWSYPNNPNSVKNMPLHYIPLWYPDGQYTVLCTAFGAWSPNGKMYADLPGSVTVSGNMYDRITSVGY